MCIKIVLIAPSMVGIVFCANTGRVIRRMAVPSSAKTPPLVWSSAFLRYVRALVMP